MQSISIKIKNNKKSRSNRDGFLRFTIPKHWVLAACLLIFLTVVATAILFNRQASIGLPNTNYIIADLIRGLVFSAVFGFFGGFYYWFGKMFRIAYNKWLAGAHFWLLFTGVNIGRFPAHYINMQINIEPGQMNDRVKFLEMLNSFDVIGGWVSFAGIVVFFVMLIEALLISRRPIPVVFNVSEFD